MTESKPQPFVAQLKLWQVADSVANESHWVAAMSAVHAVIVLLDELGVDGEELGWIAAPPEIWEVPMAEAMTTVFDADPLTPGDVPTTLWALFMEDVKPGVLASSAR